MLWAQDFGVRSGRLSQEREGYCASRKFALDSTGVSGLRSPKVLTYEPECRLAARITGYIAKILSMRSTSMLRPPGLMPPRCSLMAQPE